MLRHLASGHAEPKRVPVTRRRKLNVTIMRD